MANNLEPANPVAARVLAHKFRELGISSDTSGQQDLDSVEAYKAALLNARLNGTELPALDDRIIDAGERLMTRGTILGASTAPFPREITNAIAARVQSRLHTSGQHDIADSLQRIIDVPRHD